MRILSKITQLLAFVLVLGIGILANESANAAGQRENVTTVKELFQQIKKHISKRERGETLIRSHADKQKPSVHQRQSKKVAKKVKKPKSKPTKLAKKQPRYPSKLTSVPVERPKTTILVDSSPRSVITKSPRSHDAGQTKKVVKREKPAKQNVQVASRTPGELKRPTARKVIRYNRGGQVAVFALQVAKIRDRGTTVAFAGPCDSACTLHLGLPKKQLCITRGASFGFHQASFGRAQSGSRARRSDVATQYLMKQYPGWVRNWIAKQGGLTSKVERMPYQYASQYLETCTT